MSEIRTLRDGDIDVLPRTVASAVQTADGSTVEDKINSIEAPDLSAYATTAYVDGQVDVLESSISGLSQTVTTQGENISALETEVDDLKNSVSDGKTLVANAITAKGVTTATTASFQIMANNIASINTLPNSLSSYEFPATSTSYTGGYKLIASKTFSRPIICVICDGINNYVDIYTAVQLFFPQWNYTILGNSSSHSSMVSFNKTSYYETPLGIALKMSNESTGSGDLYISFSSDSKTIYLYGYHSSFTGTFNFDENVKVYY